MKLKLKIASIIGSASLGLILSSGGAMAAETLICSVGSSEPATVTCSGTGWDTQLVNPVIRYNGSNECGGTGCNPCPMDENGDFTACEVCSSSVPAGTWYLYGTQDNCQTSTADTVNPHIVNSAATLDPATIVGGLAGALDSWQMAFTPVMVKIILALVGIWALFYLIGLLRRLLPQEIKD